MNKRGQALVEFIIILPILIFILFAIIDFGIMSYNKNKLENIINDIDKMYSNNETDEIIKSFVSDNDKDIIIETNISDNYINIKLTKKYEYITPGLSKLLNQKNIIVERKIYNEQKRNE